MSSTENGTTRSNRKVKILRCLVYLFPTPNQLFVVLAHVGKQLLAWHDARFGILVGPDDNHESHGHISFRFRVKSQSLRAVSATLSLATLIVERETARSTA